MTGPCLSKYTDLPSFCQEAFFDCCFGKNWRNGDNECRHVPYHRLTTHFLSVYHQGSLRSASNIKRGFKYLLWHHTFSIPGVTPLGEVVHCGKLNEGREDKGIADSDKPVHSCGIGHFRERVPGADTECGHGQDSGHSCREINRQDGYVKSDQISVATITHLCKIRVWKENM